ncbi:MAG TPA: bifunctional DNA-formamidopyrimidine glycosylase/DNA-(apurinic or apyrimidinic site) lyase [Nevskiaceae bacterium]|nr:bifunctional DNA-formamidopyrimidine glycosylase/DNA-(apurinic or apyrimidinic site) lyase [Nevskiaceae bacterium]
MPELPEVETVRRGILPLVKGRRIVDVVVRETRMRWPIPKDFPRYAQGRRIEDVQRRGKYLIVTLDQGDRILIHLGMTGRLLVLDKPTELRKHDHVDFVLDNGLTLRFNDARRFGAVLPWPAKQVEHALVKDMGPEPLGDEFSGGYLYALSRGRTAPVKAFIMDGQVVVGVGNIYATEALFRAGIRPQRLAGKVTRAEYDRLVKKIRDVLNDAIGKGGTTLRDFASVLGDPGDFAQRLRVYDREGQPCRVCKTPIKRIVIGNRSSFYCPSCQK